MRETLLFSMNYVNNTTKIKQTTDAQETTVYEK